MIALCVVAWCHYKKRDKSSVDLTLNLVSNCMALVPIVCLLLNMLYSSYKLSFPEKFDMDALDKMKGAPSFTPAIDSTAGSEVTLFLALIYAAVIIFMSIWRNVRLT